MKFFLKTKYLYKILITNLGVTRRRTSKRANAAEAAQASHFKPKSREPLQTVRTTRETREEKRMAQAQIFSTKSAAEKAAASVNHYLAEQEMYLEGTVIEVVGGYAVAVVSCY